MNPNCVVKYCQVCHRRLIQTYVREENDHVVRTRRCPQCGVSIRTVELSMEQFNQTMAKFNKIFDVLSEDG
jgi:transcriptional regulator NrdR family protein